MDNVQNDLTCIDKTLNMDLTTTCSKEVNHRWGNDKDKAVFEILNEYLIQNNIELRFFTKSDGINDSNKPILESIAEKLGWKRKLKHLYSRIQKLS